MGQLKSDGKAINVTAPAGTIDFGELYHIEGWNGIAMKDVASTDTDRGLALEVSERIWYVTIPNIAAAKGAKLYWADYSAAFVGATGLAVAPETAGDPPACIVEEAVDANKVAGIRVLNGFGTTN